MSAGGPVDLVQQGERQRAIASALYSAFPGEQWERLEAYFAQAGEFSGGTVLLYDAAGNEASHPIPAQVLLDLIQLRDEMWNPETAPWYHVQVSGTSAGEFRYFFNYERRFDLNRRPLDRYSVTADPTPTDADLVADLATFPRSADHVPAWYPTA